MDCGDLVLVLGYDFNFGGGMDMVSGNSMSWGVDTGYHIVSMENNTSINNFTFGLHMKWGMSN